MSGTILVLGASGTVGTPLVSALAEAGTRVRAASRSGRAPAGAEGIAFDFADPARFGPVLDGVDAMFVLAPTGTTDPKATVLPVIEAAARAKVKVVLQTAMGVEHDDAIPYRQIELALERSGARHVILRPNWFADNFHTFWKAGVGAGLVEVPAGEGRTSFVDARDIAASAAAALTSDRFDGEAFTLTGPEALSYAQAAAILSDSTGRPVAYRAVDDATFVANLSAGGVDPAYAGFLASIFHPVREGWTAAVTGDVERLTGRAPRSLRTYAEDNAARLRS